MGLLRNSRTCFGRMDCVQIRRRKRPERERAVWRQPLHKMHWNGGNSLNREDKKQAALGYVFLLPSFVMFAVFMFYPLFYTLYLSFFEWNMVKPVKKFVGLGNYISVLKDPNTWKIFGNTFWYIVILLVFNFVMPYILSFILSCVIKKGQSFYKAVFFPAECDFAGRRLDSVYMDSESDFGSSRDCGRLVWAETAVLVENGGLGHRGTLHYHDLEDVWLQFHQHSGGCLRCLNGGHRGGASGKCADVEDF